MRIIKDKILSSAVLKIAGEMFNLEAHREVCQDGEWVERDKYATYPRFAENGVTMLFYPTYGFIVIPNDLNPGDIIQSLSSRLDIFSQKYHRKFKQSHLQEAAPLETGAAHFIALQTKNNLWNTVVSPKKHELNARAFHNMEEVIDNELDKLLGNARFTWFVCSMSQVIGGIDAKSGKIPLLGQVFTIMYDRDDMTIHKNNTVLFDNLTFKDFRMSQNPSPITYMGDIFLVYEKTKSELIKAAAVIKANKPKRKSTPKKPKKKPTKPSSASEQEEEIDEENDEEELNEIEIIEEDVAQIPQLPQPAQPAQSAQTVQTAQLQTTANTLQNVLPTLGVSAITLGNYEKIKRYIKIPEFRSSLWTVYALIYCERRKIGVEIVRQFNKLIFVPGTYIPIKPLLTNQVYEEIFQEVVINNAEKNPLASNDVCFNCCTPLYGEVYVVYANKAATSGFAVCQICAHSRFDAVPGCFMRDEGSAIIGPEDIVTRILYPRTLQEVIEMTSLDERTKKMLALMTLPAKCIPIAGHQLIIFDYPHRHSEGKHYVGWSSNFSEYLNNVRHLTALREELGENYMSWLEKAEIVAIDYRRA